MLAKPLIADLGTFMTPLMGIYPIWSNGTQRGDGRTERVWVQPFDSKMLDKLADRLEIEGFVQIKGPEHTKSGTKWHISLTGDKKNSQDLVNYWKNSKVNWYLWLVPKPNDNCKDNGKGCPIWTRIN